MTIFLRSRAGRAAAALAAISVALVAGGCSAPGQAHRNMVARNRSADAAIRSTVAHLPCAATTAKPTKRLPAAFKAVAVVRCYSKARGITGHGLWRFNVQQQADHRLAAFIAALRRPSIPTPPQVACAVPGYLDPSFVLVDHNGRVLRPALPVGECGRPFAAALTALEHLPWVTLSVHRTVQIATRAELRSGCDSQWKDLFRFPGGAGPPQPSSAPAFSPRPPQLRICIYQDRTHTFVRGGIISQAAESKLLRDIQGGRSSVRCRQRHTEYAVLLAVSPKYRGGQFAEAELGGCHRILRPDNKVGTISASGLDIIRAVGR